MLLHPTSTTAHVSRIQRRFRNEVSHSKKSLQLVAKATTEQAYCAATSLSISATGS
jgi:hypothetical protein